METDHTHMPHIFENKLYHCRAPLIDKVLTGGIPYRPYEIYRSDINGDNLEKIGSGFGDRAISCSPCAFRENGILKLSYVSTPTYSDLIYRQYQKEFNGNWSMKKFVQNPFGFRVYCNTEDARRQYCCYASFRDSRLFINDKIYKFKTNIKLNVGILRRAIPVDDQENKVLITYSTWDDKEIQTSLLDLSNMTSKKVLVNGKHIYKCTMHENFVVHAVRGEGAYNMKLQKNNYTLASDNITWEVCDEIFVAKR